ncbi:MAG: hypothetical protein JW864_13300 [Spirochaetes bacterium]|nr:hypothetical protein [Spirochaetota bacterium]
MKYKNWYLSIALGLILFSAISYFIQISIFHKTDDTFFYMLQDISFVPVQVLLVTLILDRVLKKREKQSLLNKLNMVIGVFFNDIGIDLLTICTVFFKDIDKLNEKLQITVKWGKKDFNNLRKEYSIHAEDLELDTGNLKSLQEFLNTKKDGLLTLLANPNLLEHDAFTNLLWAVFHLADELSHRKNFSDLPKTDLDHLKADMIRAYRLLVVEWLSYMKHLKNDYPYLFSIAVRTSPFNPDAKITVE